MDRYILTCWVEPGKTKRKASVSPLLLLFLAKSGVVGGEDKGIVVMSMYKDV